MTYDKDMPAAPGPSSRRPAPLAGDLRVALTHAVRRIRMERSSDQITDVQYSVLAALSMHGPMAPSTLAEHEHVQPPHMTRVVTALEQAGLVQRSAHPTDGRQVVVSITDAGQDEVRETRRRRDAWLAERLATLTADEREVLAGATALIRRIVDR